MSQDEQDAIIGRVIRRRKEESLKLKALQTEAESLGTLLVEIGEAIRRFPESIYSQEETCQGEIAGREPYRLPADFVTAEKIQKLAKDMRECMAEMADLEKQKAALGI